MTENQKYAYEYETLLVEFDKGVCILTLNRPEKRNAMNPALGEEITDALEHLRNDERCAVLVITGAGESFCAGMDLKEFFLELEDKPAEYDRAHRLAVEWRGRTLRLFPKPTIAMVNGHCFGGAFTIVEGCDLAVAAEDAKMGLSEVNFKLVSALSITENSISALSALMVSLKSSIFPFSTICRRSDIALGDWSVTKPSSSL